MYVVACTSGNMLVFLALSTGIIIYKKKKTLYMYLTSNMNQSITSIMLIKYSKTDLTAIKLAVKCVIMLSLKNLKIPV